MEEIMKGILIHCNIVPVIQRVGIKNYVPRQEDF